MKKTTSQIEKQRPQVTQSKMYEKQNLVMVLSREAISFMCNAGLVNVSNLTGKCIQILIAHFIF